jgi:putative flippase GtrA
VVDEGLFFLLSFLLRGSLSGLLLTAVPTVTARVVSCLFNFYMNKKLVFHSNVSTGTAMLRYFALAVPQLLVQLGLTHGAYLLFSIGNDQTVLRAVIYAIVMVVLYFASFVIQQHWVFAGRKKER